VTRKGIGVGQGLRGELLTELRVLLSTECGHWGGPERDPSFESPPVEDLPRKHGIFVQPPTLLPGKQDELRNYATNYRLGSTEILLAF
jgi:hypothetical protein